jgi:hypothetical protein
VVRDEGPRQCAAGNRLHHRRLDFEETARRQHVADGRDGAAAQFEHAAHVGVDDEIEVTLAIARLDVLKAMPLLRQRQETLREERERRRPDREFVGLGAEEMA